MIIRPEQIEQIQKSRLVEYVEALARHLERNFAVEIEARQLMGKHLRDSVRQAVQDARDYGVRNPEDVKLYVECIVLLSPKFDVSSEFAWAGAILRSPDLTGTAKMDAVNQMLLFGPGGPR